MIPVTVTGSASTSSSAPALWNASTTTAVRPGVRADTVLPSTAATLPLSTTKLTSFVTSRSWTVGKPSPPTDATALTAEVCQRWATHAGSCSSPAIGCRIGSSSITVSVCGSQTVRRTAAGAVSRSGVRTPLGGGVHTGGASGGRSGGEGGRYGGESGSSQLGSSGGNGGAAGRGWVVSIGGSLPISFMCEKLLHGVCCERCLNSQSFRPPRVETWKPSASTRTVKPMRPFGNLAVVKLLPCSSCCHVPLTLLFITSEVEGRAYLRLKSISSPTVDIHFHLPCVGSLSSVHVRDKLGLARSVSLSVPPRYVHGGSAGGANGGEGGEGPWVETMKWNAPPPVALGVRRKAQLPMSTWVVERHI
eukprot:scaffold60761_cov58-Phaeocystis_antarctica.AAC.5